MQLRGHNFVWDTDKQIPNWLVKEELSITSDKAKSSMGDYIYILVGHYRGVSKVVTSGDEYYQSVQQCIDNKFDIMVTELDVAIPTNDGYPINSGDL